MTEYAFILHFQLPNADDDYVEDYLDALFESGCDDALVGAGLSGVVALDFTREAKNVCAALKSAIENVLTAIPEAKLTEIGPDLLNTTDIASVITDTVKKMTRQAIRKYTVNQAVKAKSRFPAAAISGSSPLWHLSDVIHWMIENKKLDGSKADVLLETTATIRKINAVIQSKQVGDWSAEKSLGTVEALIAKNIVIAVMPGSKNRIGHTSSQHTIL